MDVESLKAWPFRRSLRRQAATAIILCFRAGSFEWQASGQLREAKNALRRLGAEVSPTSKAPEIQLDDGRILVLEFT